VGFSREGPSARVVWEWREHRCSVVGRGRRPWPSCFAETKRRFSGRVSRRVQLGEEFVGTSKVVRAFDRDPIVESTDERGLGRGAAGTYRKAAREPNFSGGGAWGRG